MICGVSSSSSLAHLLQMQKPGSQKAGPSAEEIFSAIDANGDGGITKGELAAAKAQKAAQFSNRIMSSQSDSTASLVALLQGVSDAASGADQVEGTGVSGKAAMKLPSVEAFLARSDANGDGILTLDEFKSAGTRDTPSGTAGEIVSFLARSASKYLQFAGIGGNLAAAGLSLLTE